jgi:4-amino-4-deoxy-L-arabinose transferase-like glycosyltransferase
MFAAPPTSPERLPPDTEPPTRRLVALLAIVFAVIWFANLDYRRLIHPDEGRYAEIPREMATTGDWVTPRLNGIKYFEKPALQYWMTAAAYRAFGIHQWTARLWPALSGFLGVVFIGFVGLRIAGPLTGMYAAAALGSCVWYALNAHVLTLDAGVTFCMAAGLGSLLIAQRAESTRRQQRNWMLTAWVALALAVLSKGLIGLVLPGGALIVYTAITRDWALWRRLHLVTGTLVFVAVAAPWFVVVSLRNREFFDFFFIHEHFTRFLTHEARREGPWWYFIPIFIVGVLPWLTVVAWTARSAWVDARIDRNGFSWERFAIVWTVVIFVFFSASGSKLPSYILPIFPAIALIVGAQLVRLPSSTLARLTVPLVVMCGVCAAVVLFGYAGIAERFADARQPLAPLLAYAPWIQAGLTLAFVGGAASLLWLRAGKRTAAILSVALTSLAASMLVLSGHDELADTRSAAPLLAKVTGADSPLRTDVPFYSVKMYDQTLPYYLGHTVIQVQHEDELAMGIASEPAKAIATLSEWKRRWDTDAQAYAIMQPEEYDALRADGVAMRELARDPRRVIVSRR